MATPAEAGPYAVNGHVAATRPLRGRDTSRYGQVRLTITRDAAASGTVSVIVRSVGGGLLRDTRLHAGKIPMEPGSAESIDPIAALEAALAALKAARR